MNPTILYYGTEILSSEKMQSEKNYFQHGNISCYDHSVHVAVMSLRIASYFFCSCNIKSLVRGALLHDYFLYDWHVYAPDHKLHGFIHARRALENAKRDFILDAIEQDIIFKHMFPLNFRFPKYRESWIVCIADKLCAVNEIFFSRNSR